MGELDKNDYKVQAPSYKITKYRDKQYSIRNIVNNTVTTLYGEDGDHTIMVLTLK